jgi:uncharacterized protein
MLNALPCPYRNIITMMTGNDDDPGFRGVLVNAVISACPLIDPSVVLDRRIASRTFGIDPPVRFECGTEIAVIQYSGILACDSMTLPRPSDGGTIGVPSRRIRVARHRDIAHRRPAAKGVCSMIESVVESIRVSLVTNQRVVILKELEGERYLPIWIGHFEAEAIAMELQGVEAARPLPYDIMKTIIGDLGGKVRRILVTGLREDVFYATIVIEAAGRQVEVDSRPSDAIAIAVRTKVPIFVDESVMDKAGVLFGEDEEEDEAKTSKGPSSTVDDAKLSSFREFINSLDFSDEDKKGNS